MNQCQPEPLTLDVSQSGSPPPSRFVRAVFRLKYFRDFLEYVGAVSLALFLLGRARDGELLTAQLGQSFQNLALLTGKLGWSLDNQVHNLIASPRRVAEHGNALLTHNQARPCLGPGRYLQNFCTLY